MSYSQQNGARSGKTGVEADELGGATAVVCALSKITRARQILEEVVISSENFDYRKAKVALKELQKMIRELGRAQARLRSVELCSPNAGADVVPFPGRSGGSDDSLNLV